MTRCGTTFTCEVPAAALAAALLAMCVHEQEAAAVSAIACRCACHTRLMVLCVFGVGVRLGEVVLLSRAY